MNFCEEDICDGIILHGLVSYHIGEIEGNSTLIFLL